MALKKTYVLLDHMNPVAPVFLQVNQHQRQRLDKLRIWQPALQVAFTDENGKNRVLRLKLNTDKIYQDEQIKDGILANERFTDNEREIVKFQYGVLETDNVTVQAFLEAHPSFDGFKGKCQDILRPAFTVYNRMEEVERDNQDFLLRLKAGNKIASMTLKEGQDMLIRVYGSFYKPPSTQQEVTKELVGVLDNADEALLNAIISSSISDNEKTDILIGRAVHAGILSFEAVPNFVCKIVGGKPVKLREVSSSHDINERRRYFAEYISSEAGKLVYQDLEKEVAKVSGETQPTTPPVSNEQKTSEKISSLTGEDNGEGQKDQLNDEDHKEGEDESSADNQGGEIKKENDESEGGKEMAGVVDDDSGSDKKTNNKGSKQKSKTKA